MLVKLTVFALWIGLLTISYREAMRIDTDLFGSGRPIANLAASAGEVQVRPIEFEVWSYVDSGHSLFEGNVLATGEKSGARVSFDNGRDLIVGANTQIVLSQETAERGGELVVTLLKGSLSTENGQEPENGTATKLFRLRSGSSDFVIKHDETQLNIEKSVSSDRAKITVKTGEVEMVQRTDKALQIEPVAPRVLQASALPVEVVVNDKSQPQPIFKAMASVKPVTTAAKALRFQPGTNPPVEKIPEILPEIVPSEKHQVQDKPLLAVKDESIAIKPPRVIAPGAGVYWHVASIARGKAGAFFVRMATAGSANNFLKVSGSRSQKWVPTKNEATITTAIRSSDIVALSSAAITGWELTLQGGASPNASSLKGMQTSTPVSYRFRSLADLGTQSMRANFLSTTIDDRVPDWFYSQEELPRHKANYSVVVRQGQDLVGLAPHLASSKSFSVEPDSFPESGTYIATREGLIAAVSGKNLNPKTLARIQRSLKGKIVYKGTSQALLAAADRESLMAIIKQVSGDIYVLQNERLTRVNRNLLVEKPVAAQFILDNGQAFFSESVEIVGLK